MKFAHIFCRTEGKPNLKQIRKPIKLKENVDNIQGDEGTMSTYHQEFGRK